MPDNIVIHDIKGHIKLLSGRIERLRKLISSHIDNDPDLHKQKGLLFSISGIGDKTVAVLLSYFSSIDRFKHAKKLASFCGVTPKVFNSGSSISKYRRISKWGRLI
jgi:transposase